MLAEAGTTTLYVTHDQTEAMGLADRIAMMHEGRIVQMAPPVEIYRHPRTMFVGGFIGNPPMNFLRAAGERRRGAAGRADADAAGRRNGAVMLGIRPEDLELAEGGFGFRVQVAEPLGPHILLTGEAEGQGMRVAIPPDHAVRAGETVICGRSSRISPGWMRRAGSLWKRA